MRAALPLVLASAALIALAPPTQPAPVFAGARLRAGVDTFLTITTARGRPDTIGWATQALTRSSVRGRDTWVQVYRWHGRDGSASTDSLVVDARTLLPLTESRKTDVGGVQISYDGARVRAAIRPSGQAGRQLDTTFAAPVFASAALDAVARVLPTDAGGATELDLYYPFPAPFGVRRVKVAVTGSAVVPTRERGRVDCWIVTAELPGGASRFWVTKATRELLQFSSGEGDATYFFRRPGAPAI